MPEVYMQIEWPDQKRDRIYSPSSVIHDYFLAGQSLPVAAFEQKITEALIKASGRVLAKYGYECTSALSEIARVGSILNRIEDKSEEVKIIHL